MGAYEDNEIKSAKDEWSKAYAKKDQAGMDAAHARAEAARSKMGYSGGDDGGKTIVTNERKYGKYLAEKNGTAAQQFAAGAANPSMPNISKSGLRTGKQLSDMYGVTYDRNQIQGIFNDATKSQYDALRKEYATTENKFYDNMQGTQATALDTIRRSNAQAVATGASRGVQAANELSSVLGLEQEGVANATQLSQDRNLLMDKEQAAYAQNASNALTTANAAGLGLGNLGANLYASDTQFDVGKMNMYAQLDANMKNLQGVGVQADAQRYTADKNYDGNRYTADKNYDSTKYNADRNYDGTKLTTQANKDMNAASNASNQEVARIQKQAQIGAANISAAAQRASARISAGTGQSQESIMSVMNGLMANPTEQNKFLAKMLVGGNMSESEFNTYWQSMADAVSARNDGPMMPISKMESKNPPRGKSKYDERGAVYKIDVDPETGLLKRQ